MSVSTLGFKGKVTFIQVSTDGGTTWKVAAALDKKSFKLGNEDIDTTNDTTAGSLKELSPGVQTPTLDVEGFSYSAAAPSGYSSFKELLGFASAQTVINVRITDNIVTPVNRNISGTAYVKDIEEMYETNKYTTFKASFSFQTLVIV